MMNNNRTEASPKQVLYRLPTVCERERECVFILYLHGAPLTAPLPVVALVFVCHLSAYQQCV